jgi:hypothetical protein
VPFFALNFSHADWLAAAVVIAVGSITLIGLGILEIPGNRGGMHYEE